MRTLFALLAWLITASLVLVASAWLAFSGHVELTLLGFSLPPAFLLASVFAFIAWADAGWREVEPAAEACERHDWGSLDLPLLPPTHAMRNTHAR